MSRIAQHTRRLRPWLALAAALVALPALLRAETLAAAGGTNTARVVIVTQAGAMETYRPDTAKIEGMVERGLLRVTDQRTVADAWRSLVSTQDTVGIKVISEPGPTSGTRPPVVAAVVKGLLAAGVRPDHIVIWDKNATALRQAGYFELARKLGVRAAGARESGWDPQTFYDTALLGSLVHGDLEFGQKGEGVGRKSFVAKLVSSELTKIINIAPLLNHNYAGVSGQLWSLALGCVDNTLRFENSAERLAVAVPEIYALPVLADHAVLNISDALLCQYEGGEQSLLHYTATLNELRFSRDPVALDTLAVQGLQRLRDAAETSDGRRNTDLYRNAALMELGVNDLPRITIERVP